MKEVVTLRAAAFRALKPRLLDRIIPQQLIEDVKAEYQFAQEQPGPEAFGFTFGKFRSTKGATIWVEQLNISHINLEATSVGAMTRSSTDDADLFLDRFLPWLGDRYKLDVQTTLPRAYHSQLEFIFDKKFGDKFAVLSSVGEMIASLIEGYGLKPCPRFQISSLAMHFDMTKGTPKPQPLVFAIERRVGASYDENKFFSQAPLRTSDHLAVLQQLEKLL